MLQENNSQATVNLSFEELVSLYTWQQQQNALVVIIQGLETKVDCAHKVPKFYTWLTALIS